MSNAEEIKKRLEEVEVYFAECCEVPAHLVDWMFDQLKSSLERESELQDKVYHATRDRDQWKATSEGHFYHKIELQKERNEYRAWLEIIAEAETEKADWYRYTAREVLTKYNKPENKLD